MEYLIKVYICGYISVISVSFISIELVVAKLIIFVYLVFRIDSASMKLSLFTGFRPYYAESFDKNH